VGCKRDLKIHPALLQKRREEKSKSPPAPPYEGGEIKAVLVKKADKERTAMRIWQLLLTSKNKRDLLLL